jgi:hypothetical protein
MAPLGEARSAVTRFNAARFSRTQLEMGLHEIFMIVNGVEL